MSGSTTDRVEVRLALILNGGVSLAVWMGGVTHEIDLLRRASANILPPDEKSPDRPVWEAWRDLCDRLGIVVKVDVVAGTSAGGLNGTFLATSIARGAALPPLQDVWRKVAQIRADETAENLLWPTSMQKASSVLNGPFFKRAVQRVLEGIPHGEADSDITLFVTATALGKAPFGVLDKAGREFVIQDHRRIYRFAHNPRYRYVPTPAGAAAGALDTLFAPETTGDAFADSERLALGARASASFPAAFQPIRETNDLNELRDHVTGESWLMDGGILNNAPFEPVINEVALRSADTPFKRALVYIVPEVDDSHVSSEPGAEPGWLRVLEATVMQPRESNLREDVDKLTTFAREAERWNRGPQKLFSEVLHDPERLAGCEAAARSLFAHYRASRIRGGIGDATRTWAQGRRSIPVSLPDAALVTVTPDGWVPADLSDATVGDSWHWGTAVADRVLRLMLRDLLSQSTDVTQSTPRQAALTVLSRQLQYVAAVRGSLNKVIQTSLAAPEPNLVAAALNVANAEQSAPQVLALIVTTGAEAYCDAVRGDLGGGTLDAQVATRAALIIEVLTHAFTADEPFVRAGRFDFFRFGPDVDSPTVKVPDPENPPDTRKSGAWKLWGTQLGHFAAFGRPEWRDQDWAWGRLDGIAHLVKLLEVERSTDLSDDLTTLQQVALQAQDLTSDSLQKATAELLDINAEDVLKKWGVPPGDIELVQALDSAVRTLSNRENKNSAFVASLGVGLGKLLASHAVPSHQVGRIMRLLRWHRRFAVVRDRIRAVFRGEA